MTKESYNRLVGLRNECYRDRIDRKAEVNYFTGFNDGYEKGKENCQEAYNKGFKEGYACGFNKANKWHYPSKGEYPKERENVWCYCKGIGIELCCMGHTIVGGDNKVRWVLNSNHTEELEVIAWKDIVLPKEIENDGI